MQGDSEVVGRYEAVGNYEANYEVFVIWETLEMLGDYEAVGRCVTF